MSMLQRLPGVLVVMGVSGSGKTTVGQRLAERLGWAFAEGDALHSAANIAKMKQGVALQDADRVPWLQAIAAQIERWRADRQHGVITCSALKRAYRDAIVVDRRQVRLVYLHGDAELIAKRLEGRRGHFMPAALLPSQFDALEEPTQDEAAIEVDAALPLDTIVAEVVARIAVAED